MMTCDNFKLLWTEWHEGYLSELNSMRLHWHMEACPQCRLYDRQMLALVNGLNTLPEPAPMAEGSTTRLFANVRTNYRHGHNRHSFQVWALAASLIVAFVGGGLFWSHMNVRGLQIPVASLPEIVAPVTLTLNRIQTVRLVLEAERNIAPVTFTIDLPEGVEIAGYPGQQRLTWKGHLDKGRNGLALPLIARTTSAGSSGKNTVLITQIEYDNNQQALKVPLDLQVEEIQTSQLESPMKREVVAAFHAQTLNREIQ